jgi:uncharacterized membrane protein
MRRLRAAVAAPLVVLALAVSGCSVTVAQSDLEAEVGRDEEGVTGVECEGDLDGTVGATQDCTATFEDGSTVDVLVTVTEVDGSDVLFDIEVPEADPEADPEAEDPAAE